MEGKAETLRNKNLQVCYSLPPGAGNQRVSSTCFLIRSAAGLSENIKNSEPKRNSRSRFDCPPLPGPQHTEGGAPGQSSPPDQWATPQTLAGSWGTPALFLFHLAAGFLKSLEFFLFLPSPPRPRLEEDGLLLCNGSSVSKSLGSEF